MSVETIEATAGLLGVAAKQISELDPEKRRVALIEGLAKSIAKASGRPENESKLAAVILNATISGGVDYKALAALGSLLSDDKKTQAGIQAAINSLMIFSKDLGLDEFAKALGLTGGKFPLGNNFHLPSREFAISMLGPFMELMGLGDEFAKFNKIVGYKLALKNLSSGDMSVLFSEGLWSEFLDLSPAQKAVLGTARDTLKALGYMNPLSPNELTGATGVYVNRMWMATLLSPTAHGTPLSPGPGAMSVICLGRPAWRVGADQHLCPLASPQPHGMGVVPLGSPDVFVEGMPAARYGDQVIEPIGGPDPILPMMTLPAMSLNTSGEKPEGVLADLADSVSGLAKSVNEALDSALGKIGQAFKEIASSLGSALQGLVDPMDKSPENIDKPPYAQRFEDAGPNSPQGANRLIHLIAGLFGVDMSGATEHDIAYGRGGGADDKAKADKDLYDSMVKGGMDKGLAELFAGLAAFGYDTAGTGFFAFFEDGKPLTDAEIEAAHPGTGKP